MNICELSLIYIVSTPETIFRRFEKKMLSIRVHDELVTRVGLHIVGINAVERIFYAVTYGNSQQRISRLVLVLGT